MKRQHRLYEWKDGKKLELGERSLVMGILNVTPDSLSDGGKWNSNTLAVSHATDMIKDGAHLIDVGQNLPDRAMWRLHRKRRQSVSCNFFLMC